MQTSFLWLKKFERCACFVVPFIFCLFFLRNSNTILASFLVTSFQRFSGTDADGCGDAELEIREVYQDLQNDVCCFFFHSPSNYEIYLPEVK